MGLIPKKYIVHVASDKSKTRLKDQNDFLKECEENGIYLLECNNSEDLKYIFYDYKPEILILSEEMYSQGFSFDEISQRQKSKYNIYKLIQLSTKRKDKKKAFAYLEEGFDDFLDSDLSPEEVFLKCFAFLRRKDILEKNKLTKLPGINRTYEIIEHCLHDLKDWQMLHLTIDNLNQYSYMYGVKNVDNLIKGGDFITSSNQKGLGQKATKPGHVIGYAVSDQKQGEDFVEILLQPGTWFHGEENNNLEKLEDRINELEQILKQETNKK